MINNLHIVSVSDNPSNIQLKTLLKCNNELVKSSNDELSTFKQFKHNFYNNYKLCHWYIFYLNNLPIGGAMIMDPDENCQAFSIGNIIIYPEFRHFGYGKQCLVLLLNKIKHINPILPIYLGVETSNIVAIHLYQEFGFKIIKKFIQYNKEFYQMCLGKPLVTEEINNLVKNNIKNNLVYHASPFKLEFLDGQKTGKWSNEVGNVFVTPCKGIAACFLINKTQILDKLSEQFPGKIIGLNFGYDIWNKLIQQLYEIPNNINILLNLPGIKPFSGTSTGYIYTIDFAKYRNNCHMFNKNPNSDVEFLIEDNVNFIKYQQVNVNWTVISSQEQIKRHGIAKVIQCYDPPYNQQQMRNAGYSQKIIEKLKNDPVHNWRMKTRIELIHQQPSLAEQKRIWKNWQLMNSAQKEISQKKSLELFEKTNEQHHKEIMINYWNEPIFQSKFQKLFQLIMENIKSFSSFNDLDSNIFQKYIPIKYHNFNENIQKISVLNEIKNISQKTGIIIPEEVNEINFLHHFIKSVNENDQSDIHGINYLNINLQRFYIGILQLLNLIFKNIYSNKFKINFNLGNLHKDRLNYIFEDKITHLTYTVIVLITELNSYEFNIDFLTIYENKNQIQQTKNIQIKTDKNINKNQFNAGKENKIIFENKIIKLSLIV